jgi:phosphoglycolate phosphatase-like HAD superfamily hydrolase
MPHPITLVLFDIDGTLVHTAGAGVRGMNAAFGVLHRAPEALDGIPIAGRTDRAIVSDAFRRLGVDPTDERITLLRDAYLTRLLEEMARPEGEGFGVLPGVRGLVDELSRRRATVVGLLTGNFVGGAAIKLGHFDLWDRFAFGAFGDRHLDRRDLVPLALAEARARGLDATAARTFVIGDTPLDVDCAHAHGAVAVAVATGNYGRDELARCGPEVTVETLDALRDRPETWGISPKQQVTTAAPERG